MRTKLLVVLVMTLALSALLLAGGASAQRQGNDNASGAAKSKRVVGVRSSDTGSGSRVTITADDTLKDYSAYRSGDRFYVVLPKAAAGARAAGSGRGYSDMQVQQRGDSVVLSYRVQPGAKPRVEQKFNRLDVVFDVPGGDAAQSAETANNGASQQSQRQTPPAETRNQPAQQNNQTQATNNPPNTNPTPERRQTAAEEAARAQAANANAPLTPVTAGPTPAGVETTAQNPAEAAPTPETQAAASPTAEPQLAQAQQPAPVVPITANQPAAATQTGISLGTFVIQNWAIIFGVLLVLGLGLIVFTRRASTASTTEAAREDSAPKLEEARASRAKETSAKALKDATSAAQASTPSVAKATPAVTTEPLSTTESADTTKTNVTTEASATDVTQLAGAAALAAGAAIAKSKKQSRKEARQEAKRKKKGGRSEDAALTQAPLAESGVAESTAEETLVEETAVEESSAGEIAFEEVAAAPATAEVDAAAEPSVAETPAHEEPAAETPAAEMNVVGEVASVDEQALVETPAVEEVAQDVPAELASAGAAAALAEVVAEPEVSEPSAAAVAETAEPEQLLVAEPSLDTTAPVADTTEVEAAEVETREVAPVTAETAEPEPFVAEAPAPVTEIELASAPEPEHVLDETRRLFEGETYNRAVVGSRDAMARQMVAAELLSALAGRNVQRRERARAAFVEHGYFDETARDLREADAPAERSAAARSLAILGDREATPMLVAALEDPVSDVRRAAVEALGTLRDPSAVGALEALLERERTERNRIPPRVIRTAIEFCREGYEAEPAPAPVPQQEETATVEVAPVEAAAVETVPEMVTPPAASEGSEETSVVPFVEEPNEAELSVAPELEPEPAPVPEPVHAEDAFETVAETAVEPFVETAQPLVETEDTTVEVGEEFVSGVAEEVALEPAAETEAEIPTAEGFEPAFEEQGAGHAMLFDAGAEEETMREIEPVAAEGTTESAPAAGEASTSEWFDFDMSEVSGESRPTSALLEPEPVASEPVFESSAGEAFSSTAGVESEETAAPVFEMSAESVGELESANEFAEAEHFASEPVAQEPADVQQEKGIAPFDEFSTVPASIQQRIAGGDAGARAAAIIELSHADTDEAFQQICSAFDDPEQEVRSAAARALYDLRADRAESFTRALREAPPERRREIGAAIASSGLAGESISQLTGESRERTYESFSLLFLMAKAGEVQPLLRAIESHPSNEVRLAVVKLLALSGQKEVLPSFRRLAVRGSLPTEVRSAVMEAIYQISSSQPTPA